jgi:hypothetical protein
MSNFFGSLLQIYPVIEDHRNGTPDVRDKIPGSWAKALQSMPDNFIHVLPASTSTAFSLPTQAVMQMPGISTLNSESFANCRRSALQRSVPYLPATLNRIRSASLTSLNIIQHQEG